MTEDLTGAVVERGAEWRFPRAAAIRRGEKTLVMGIVNMTPDSFSGRNAANGVESAVQMAMAMTEAGADMIDVGAESSRPGAEPLTAVEEMSRLGDVVKRLRDWTDKPISVDTYHWQTAEHVLRQGADIINDITALRGGWTGGDDGAGEMGEVVRDFGAHVVLMHMPCPPAAMAGAVEYGGDVVGRVVSFLRERVEFGERLGIVRSRMWLDPGFGFGKDFDQNRELLSRLGECGIGGLPLLAGFSRKRMSGGTLGASLALAVMGTLGGAEAVRAHDVEETANAVRMVDSLRRN